METGAQLITQERRTARAKDVRIMFAHLGADFAYYTVMKDDSPSYIGRIEKTKSLSEYCTCPDQFHRNNRFYRDEHGYALQCKHMVAGKRLRGWE